MRALGERVSRGSWVASWGERLGAGTCRGASQPLHRVTLVCGRCVYFSGEVSDQLAVPQRVHHQEVALLRMRRSVRSTFGRLGVMYGLPSG